MFSLAKASPVTVCTPTPVLTASYKSASTFEATAINNCFPISLTGSPYPLNTASSVILTPLATFLTATSTVLSVNWSKVNSPPSAKSLASPMYPNFGNVNLLPGTPSKVLSISTNGDNFIAFINLTSKNSPIT